MRTISLYTHGVAALLLLMALASPATGDPQAASSAEGEAWEVTSQMSMEGLPMQMPPQTQRTCNRKDSREPPPGGPPGSDCRVSNLTTLDAKTSWDVQCSGRQAMSGHGEITRSSPDAYSGFIKFASADGGMTVKLAGKRNGVCRLTR